MKTRILNLCGVASLLGFAVILGGRFFYVLLCNVRDYWPDSSLENAAECPQLAEQWVYLSIY